MLASLQCSPCDVAVEPAADSLQYGKDHIFERLSVARDHEVLTEALRHGRGKINHSELKGTLALEESSGLVLRDGQEIATAESLRRERDMIDRVNRGIGRCDAARRRREIHCVRSAATGTEACRRIRARFT